MQAIFAAALNWLVVTAPERKARQEALARALVVGVRIDIAHEIKPLRAVAVFNREADAIERQPDPTPGAIEGLFHAQADLSVAAGGDARALCGRCGAQCSVGTRLLSPQTDHQAAQHLRFEFGISRARLPDRRVLGFGGVDLHHAAMADVDLHRAGVLAFLQPGAELVALGRGEHAVEHLAQGGADEVLRNLCAIFGPVGFHDADFRAVDIEDEAQFEPEILDLWPQLFRHSRDHQPALAAGTLDAHGIGGGEHISSSARCAGLATAVCVVSGVGCHPTWRDVRDGEAIVACGRSEIRRDLERLRHLLCALVVDALGLEQ